MSRRSRLPDFESVWQRRDRDGVTVAPVTPDPMTSSSIAVPMESRRRQRVLMVQKFQHVLVAFVLLMDGFARFGHEAAPGSLVLAAAEVATSALVIGAFVRSLRKARAGGSHEEHGGAASHGVDWVDIFLSVMLVTEALVHRHETGHLPRPTILLAAVTLFIGFSHGRIWTFGQRRRALRVTETGISVGSRWGSRFNATWNEIEKFELAPHQALIVTHSGRERKIDLEELVNAPTVLGALTVARTRLEGYKKQVPGDEKPPET